MSARLPKPRIPPAVPVEDLDLPLAERRFPYRAALPEQVGAARAAAERAEATAAMNGVLAAVENLLYLFARKTFRGDQQSVIDGVVADCRIHLWAYSLPRFDRCRHSKVSTYLYVCARRFISGEARGRQASKAMKLVLFSELNNDNGEWKVQSPTTDYRLDEKIAALAGDILKRPLAYLTAPQARALSAVVENPHVPMKVLSQRLGYQWPASFSIMLARIREIIAAIDIENWERPSSELANTASNPQ